MTDGHSAPPADAPAPAAAADCTPAPVPADVRSHAHHQQAAPTHEKEQVSSMGRITPRPTFLEHLATSRDSQFQLDRRDSSELDRYFHGPRNMEKHSKWPIMMRMHGSVMPKMIMPLLTVAAWSTAITVFSRLVHNHGRKYWAQLIQTSRNLSRTIWINTGEREGEEGKDDVLRKLSAMNLILAFAVSLKHKLRFEPDIAYEDLAGLAGHLDTFARDAHDRMVVNPPPKSIWKSAGEYLGVSFAESNPRKYIKRSKKPLGHLPLEILNHLSAYIDSCVANGTLVSTLHQGQAITMLSTLNEVLTGTERVLDTPLPTAYSIAIAQISWIYILVLPFQLYNALEWITIPASIVAAYIILGLATIGSEIENPFGQDVNDLPLDTYCRQIAVEIDIMTATPRPNVDDFMSRPDNLVLFPLSQLGYPDWKERSVEDIRGALRTKMVVSPSSASATSEGSTIVESTRPKTTASSV
ncbi:hypothetical protein PCG10_009582 [Penicillium crustosum]|uniref:Uncharacterized protein n=1 Tax=Penicillium crustosum TaxID=36656 RepID=A0A9P5GQU7_PENCR|nr:hypothetical protein PCG10_009582 [Penicillium crustosum]